MLKYWASSILNNPRMLILDEATAALDTESEQIIQKSSFSYMKEHDGQFAPPKLPFTRQRAVMMRNGNFILKQPEIIR